MSALSFFVEFCFLFVDRFICAQSVKFMCIGLGFKICVPRQGSRFDGCPCGLPRGCTRPGRGASWGRTRWSRARRGLSWPILYLKLDEFHGPLARWATTAAARGKKFFGNKKWAAEERMPQVQAGGWYYLSDFVMILLVKTRIDFDITNLPTDG